MGALISLFLITMFSFRPKFNKKNIPPPTPKIKERPKRLVKIPFHFQRNDIVTYSEKDMKRELYKYPGLLKTLGHAYQYEIIYTSKDGRVDYWFCRDLPTTTKLLKYLNEQGWTVDWREKPFVL
ncbi:hypothetical protein Cyast_1902 [Cyanobacterium stanieri PCC 7202]|uniref:Uncharacterized protein n=1 Tax=Cyanobacterium stanieri (strain ATCC 29140 / PCC 7202) TaxID=292563 RepID=K9YN19_CYASC|nr:hypothetical protein Cyast_1902 [Cyanobacterium stanieri PCC 7202]